MYTEQDFTDIRAALRRHEISLGVALVLLLAVYIFALARGVQALAYAAAVLLAIAACYGLLAKIVPCARYLRFLTDMKQGGSHRFEGTVTAVGEKEELQDGARVLPVTLLLDDPADERAFYLNATKAAGFPGAGAHVRLECFGRHIKAVETL